MMFQLPPARVTIAQLFRPLFTPLLTPFSAAIALLVGAAILAPLQQPAQAQQTMQLRANVTEANSKTGVVVARGNVQITYAARQIEATAAQAMYFSKEGRIVLSGNVNILQEGNRLRGETVTYLVNEGRFVALPEENRQVEATYIMKDSPDPAPAPAAVPTNPASVKPAKLPFPVTPSAAPPKLPAPTPEKPATP
jgi:lipopolysaccharide export system protein LptA